jgi:GNAT superfamily N-acetyltransferase
MRAGADEVLETGLRPTTPDGDNLLLGFVRGSVASWRALGDATGGPSLETDAVAAADGGSPADLLNWAVLTRPLDAASAREVVETLRTFFAARPGGPYLVVSAWPTPDLSGLGLHLVGHPPLMVRAPHPGPEPPPAGLTIVEVHDARTGDDFERTLVDAYPLPALQPWARGTVVPAFGVAGWHHFVGYEGGRAVATAASWVHDDHVRIDLVSTLPDARGRGHGAALTAAAGAAAPSLPALLVASDAGRPVYERMGYLPVLRCTVWEGDR